MSFYSQRQLGNTDQQSGLLSKGIQEGFYHLHTSSFAALLCGRLVPVRHKVRRELVKSIKKRSPWRVSREKYYTSSYPLYEHAVTLKVKALGQPDGLALPDLKKLGSLHGKPLVPAPIFQLLRQKSCLEVQP